MGEVDTQSSSPSIVGDDWETAGRERGKASKASNFVLDFESPGFCYVLHTQSCKSQTCLEDLFGK